MASRFYRELASLGGVQFDEDARTSHPCERGAGLLRLKSNPQDPASQKILAISHAEIFWRCVMSCKGDPCLGNEFGTLQGCFVEGSAEQRARERRIRRRALVISIAAQTTILTAVVLLPLFGKPERLAFANPIPIPPYTPARSMARQAPPAPPTERHRISPEDLYSTPNHIPRHIDTTPDLPADPPGIPTSTGPVIPCVGCIPIADASVQPQPPAPQKPEAPRRIVMTRLEPAMLIYRVEPVYPPLARQIRRGGRVELRAVIATDGTIQSLQVVSGDPIFLQSAEAAVRQWRYRPTVLNGRPVEIDTFITVTYNLTP